jgi:hypothetical protein
MHLMVYWRGLSDKIKYREIDSESKKLNTEMNEDLQISSISNISNTSF